MTAPVPAHANIETLIGKLGRIAGAMRVAICSAPVWPDLPPLIACGLFVIGRLA